MTNMTCEKRLSAAAANWLARRFGHWERIDAFARQRTRHRVFSIAAPAGRFVLKLHGDEQSWNAEVFAYRTWCSRGGGCFPELLGVLDPGEGMGILIGHLDGRPLEASDLPEAVICAAWRKAGRLAALVGSQGPGEWFGAPDRRGRPLEVPLADPVEYVRSQVRTWAGTAREMNLLTCQEEALARWADGHAESYAGEVPQPVNRDFTPGNWMVDSAGNFVGAVDLEEMRWGTRAEGLAHLYTKFAWDHPGRAAAFFQGYGDSFVDRQPVQLRVACIVLGLATLVRGAKWSNPMYVHRGQAILGRLAETMAEQPPPRTPP